MMVRFQFEICEITSHHLKKSHYPESAFLLHDMTTAVQAGVFSWETKGCVSPISLGRALLNPSISTNFIGTEGVGCD